MTACCKLWLNRWRDAVPFEYQPRHAPCPYAGHTFYLVNSFLPKEVTTPPTSHHDLTELLHDASLVLENLHGTASCHLNGNPPFTMRGGGSGCAGVRCSIIASIFAHTFFRPPSFHPPLLCSNADAAAPCAAPCAAAPIFQRKGRNRKRNNSATQAGTICKATHDCPLSKDKDDSQRRGRLWMGDPKRTTPPRRPIDRSKNENKSVDIRWMQRDGIYQDGFSWCPPPSHTLPPQPTEAAVPPPVVSTASNPLIRKRTRRSRQRQHHHHQLCKRLVRQTTSLFVIWEVDQKVQTAATKRALAA